MVEGIYFQFYQDQANKIQYLSNKNPFFCLQFYILESCKKMKEETSELQLNSSFSNLKKSVSQINFDPFQEIGIQLDRSNAEDREELQQLIGQMLNFPSSQFAQLHYNAMRIGNFDLQTSEKIKQQAGKITGPSSSEQLPMDEDRKICPCCGFVKQTDNIKICTPMDSIKNIGTSTQLYFSTFKSLSMLLGIMFVVYCIYSLITNYISAKDNSSIADYIKISLAAKQIEDTESHRTLYFVQCWLGLLTILLWIIAMFGTKYFQIKEAIQYDNDTASCSDYSIVIEGIPMDVTKDQIQSQLADYYQSVVIQYKQIPEKRRRPFKIAKFNVAKPFYLDITEFNRDQIKDLQKQIGSYRQMFTEWVLERKNRPTFSEPKEKRKQIYERYIKAIQKKNQIYQEEFEKIKKKLQDEKGAQLTTAFLTFETNISRDLMVQLNQNTVLSKFKGIFGDRNKFVLSRKDGSIVDLKIDVAPEPEDIKWSNIGLSDCSVYLRKLFTYGFTLCLLGGSFGIIYALSKKQNQIINDPTATDSASRYLSIAISMVIALTNVVIGQVIKFLTLFERDYTTTYNQASLAVKSIFAQMINSILIPVVVARYIKQDIYGASGLVDNIFMMSFSTALVSPFVVLLDPANILQKLKKCWKSRISSKLSQNQKEHNTIYEGIEFEVGYQYIYIGNVFMFNCFFVSLQPICVVGALLGFLLMYWIQKYCMFYRYRRPVPGSDFVNQAVWQIINLGPLLYCLGSLTWANFLPDGFPQNAIIPNLIALGFSVLIIFVPIKSILIGCFFNQEASKLSLYQQNRITFSSEYDRLNPSTQDQGLKQFQEFSQKFAENFTKLSNQKKAELQKKIIQNNQKGQLNQANQASHNAPNLGILGGQNTANLFSSLIQPQPGPNPFAMMIQANQQFGGGQTQPIRQHQVAPASQAQPNPFAAMFGGGGQPQHQQPQYQPQFSQFRPSAQMGMPGMNGPGFVNPMMGMMGMGGLNGVVGSSGYNPYMMGMAGQMNGMRFF